MAFRNPEALWGALLALPLILLYILKVRREEQRVPSTWLWEAAMREVAAQVPFRRLRRDWLLLLELLVLAAVVLAAAGPFRKTTLPPGQRVAIVMDASASMLAADRMERARERARAIVDSRGAGDEVLVVRAGVEARVIIALTDDRVALREGIEGLRAFPAPARIDAALALARSVLGPDGRVVLVTDGGSVFDADAVDRVERVGQPRDNVGIVALGVRPSDPSGLDHQVFVRLRNAGSAAATGRLELRVNDDARDATAVAIPPGEDVTRTLRLVDLAAGRIEARWVGAASDALADDDRAGWVLVPPRSRRYRIHGQADLFLRHALAAVEGWAPAEVGGAVDLDLYVRDAPAETGPPYVWIDPLALREAVVEGAAVLSWDRTHPVLRYANLNAVRFGRIARLRRPPGARVLAESTAGPLILEGGSAARRGIIWGFEPLQSDFPLSVSFPVLVHNTLQYLVPTDGHLEGGVPSGSAPSLPWAGTEPAMLTGPTGETIPLSASGGMLQLPPLDRTGVWRLGEGAEARSFAVSLLDAGESDLLRRPPAAQPGEDATPAGVAPREGLLDLWRPFVLAALAFALLEGVAFHRRWEP